MASKGALVLSCLIITVLISGAFGQVGSLCRTNERLLYCGGCQKTCKDPAPVCQGVCRTGCYCDEGEVRNATGHCVKLADCSPAAISNLQSSEPRASDTTCPDNEEYKFCEICNKTCDNPNPVCPAQCARGCFCKEGLVRDRDGNCVTLENCISFLNKSSNSTQATPNQITCGFRQQFSSCSKCEKVCGSVSPVCRDICSPGCVCEDGYFKTLSGKCVKLEDCPKEHTRKLMTYQMTCGPHQLFSDCQKCELVCGNRNPVCRQPCVAGCFCIDGFFKSPSGKCVKQEDCPKAEVTMGGAQEPSVEDCSPDEVYLSCGWCEPSCWEPRPECPVGVCTRGCLCRPPLLRHHSGHCVEENHCAPQKCHGPNEEFLCRYGCESRCDFRKCPARPQRCVLGCHCKLGFLRDVDGRCVTSDKCLIPHKDSSRDVNSYLEALKSYTDSSMIPKTHIEDLSQIYMEGPFAPKPVPLFMDIALPLFPFKDIPFSPKSNKIIDIAAPVSSTQSSKSDKIKRDDSIAKGSNIYKLKDLLEHIVADDGLSMPIYYKKQYFVSMDAPKSFATDKEETSTQKSLKDVESTITESLKVEVASGSTPIPLDVEIMDPEYLIREVSQNSFRPSS